MARIFLGDKLTKELNRIRKDVPVPVRKGKRGVVYSDIVGFLVKFYKEVKK